MRLISIAATVAILIPTASIAQTATGQFAVRAQVNASCQVTPQDLNFGVYSSSSTATAQTPLSVRCTPGSAVTISLSAGSSGNPQSRNMQNGSNNLNYQIYRDSARTDPINTAGMAFQMSGGENTGQLKTWTLYGSVPANQFVAAGNYVDQILVTAQF
ncbi:spore coat U domain-containing protein [Sphingomonas cavernae]|nr:spore coat U domain-containing protein [Sphingomonas cavernae]